MGVDEDTCLSRYFNDVFPMNINWDKYNVKREEVFHPSTICCQAEQQRSEAQGNQT